MIETITPDQIAQLGFPIVVCAWFMLKHNKTIENNTKALMEIKAVIIKCHEVNKKCH